MSSHFCFHSFLTTLYFLFRLCPPSLRSDMIIHTCQSEQLASSTTASSANKCSKAFACRCTFKYRLYCSFNLSSSPPNMPVPNVHRVDGSLSRPVKPHTKKVLLRGLNSDRLRSTNFRSLINEN